jgi:hypothetical protein
MLGVSLSSVSRVWQEYISKIKQGMKWPKLSSPRVRVCGRKSKLNSDIPEDVLHEMSKRLKFSAPIRDQILELYDTTGYKISKSSLHRYLRKNLQYAYGCGYVKPLLSEVNRKKRVRFILNKVERLYEDNGKRPTDVYRYRIMQLEVMEVSLMFVMYLYRFKNNLNEVHIDEKWFYLNRIKWRVLRRKQDKIPSQSVVNKSKIPKLMFLTAIGVPQTRPDGTYFDGKIGIFPFIYMVPAQRTSKNRVKGTLEVKTQSVDSQAYLQMMTKNGGLLDAIREKMYWLKEKEIIVQQDNAPAHVGKNNMILLNEAGQQYGFNIKIQNQSPQSPDLNKLDLAFFNSLNKYAHNYKHNSNNITELTQNVINAYNNYTSEQLLRTNALLFVAYRQVLKNLGSVHYKMPHTHIRQKQAKGEDFIDYNVDSETVINACDFLINVQL